MGVDLAVELSLGEQVRVAHVGDDVAREGVLTQGLHGISLPNGRAPPHSARRVRIATWNVNSLRSRIDRVEAFLQRHDIDVLAVQETKAREDQLPLMGLTVLGYDIAVGGLRPVERRRDHQPGRHRGRRGRLPRHADLGRPGGRRGAGDRGHLWRRTHLVAVRPQRPQGRRPALRLQARLAGPAARGRPVDDAATSRWSATGTSPRRTRTSSTSRPSPRAPTSRRRSAPPSHGFLEDGYVDVVRPHTPGPEVYTYWDYYRQRFERNRGMRIDFVLGNPSFAARVTGAFIDRDERAGKGASDHAPVIVDLD